MLSVNNDKDSTEHTIKHLNFSYETEEIRREIELGVFKLKCIRAREYNKEVCKRHRILFEDNMTPQEELFKQLFNHEKVLVGDMSVLELRAHREELAKIAFEARARLTAVDEEERVRKGKDKIAKGPTGFSRNLELDETSSSAINAIKVRQKKMSKDEKIMAGLQKLGIDAGAAEKIMSAGSILGRLKGIKSEGETTVESVKGFTNPFKK